MATTKAGGGLRFGRYLLIKTVAGSLTVIGVLTLTFVLVRLAPGDPAARILDVYGTPEAVANLRHQMGLDRPLPEQYLEYLGGVLKGDLGSSLQSKRSVASLISAVFPHTVALAVAGTIIGMFFGLSLGIIAAAKQGTAWDYTASTVAVFGISIPLFFMGILFLILFVLQLAWLPATGTGAGAIDMAAHLVLPALALGIGLAGLVARIVRSSMIEELGNAYTITIRSIGGSRIREIRHGLKNSLVSLVSVLGIQLGRVLGGVVVLEVLFARPGLGKLIVEAIVARDYPVALGGIVFFTIVIVIVMTVTDILYGVVNPKIREAR